MADSSSHIHLLLFLRSFPLLDKKLTGVHLDQQEKQGDQQGPEDEPEESKQLKAYDDPKDSDQWMHISKFFGQCKAKDIVDGADDTKTINQHKHALP